MKYHFLWVTLLFVSSIGSAQEHPTLFRPSTLFITGGYQEINSGINNTLSQEGYKPLDDWLMAAEIGLRVYGFDNPGYLHLGITYLDLEDSDELYQPDLSMDATLRSLSGWGFVIGIGYGIVYSSRFDISPTFNWGLQKLNFNLANDLDDNSFAGLIGNQNLQNLEFDHFGGYIELGLSSTYYFGQASFFPAIGIDVGYKIDYGSNQWKMNGFPTTDMNLDLDGMYIRIVLGIGKNTELELN
jgi:hypothetical protein